ncbi:MAG: hypothetical protein GEV06_05505 [Luteitalea sp.]|nr:hypothetical protein [Luteitalea sp.]
MSTLKLSYQLSQNNKLIAVWQPSVKLQPQNGAGRFRPLEATRHYYNPTSIYKGEIQSMVTPRLLVNVVGGYAGYVADYSAPRAGFMSPDNPSRLDRETGLRTGPHEASEQRPRDRWQADGSVSFFPERFLGGRHEMKAGTSLYWEHAGSGRLNHSNGNYMLVYDRVGERSRQASEIEIINSPIEPSSWATVYAAYLKDTWRISERLTANLGLRFERQHSYLPAQSKEASPFFPELYPAGSFPKLDVLTWNAVMPRAGLAWNLNPKTVVKGTFGVFVDAIGDEFATDYNRNALSTAVFRWRDTDGNDNYTPGEVSLDLNGPDFLSITAASNNILTPNLKQPTTTEATASFERELLENLGFRALYVFKQRRRQYDEVNVLRPHSAYDIPLTRRDPGPDGVLDTGDDGGAVTIYDYDAALRGAEFVGSQRVNSDDPDSWQSIELTLTKRSTGRWSAVASFWAIKNDVWLDPLRETPNTEYFPKNQTWEWASTVSGTYRLPGDVMLSGFLQAKQGSVGARTNIFRAVDPDGGPPLAQLSTVTLRLEPYGTTHGPALKLVNLRASKRFPFGGKRIDVDFDVFNVFNSGTPTALTYASGPTFGYATNVVPARVARVGARFSF